MALAKEKIHRTNYLQDALDAGTASAMLAEIIEAVKYVYDKLRAGRHVEDLNTTDVRYLGHITDAEVRNFGVPHW